MPVTPTGHVQGEQWTPQEILTELANWVSDDVEPYVEEIGIRRAGEEAFMIRVKYAGEPETQNQYATDFYPEI